MYVSYHYSITCNHTIPLPYCTIGIVELHENAKIWAESEGEGKGCTFFVRVPVHSYRALDVSARGQTSINARETIASSSLIDPIHEFAHIDLTPESCQLALAAVSLIQCLSAKDPSKPLSPRQPLALVIPVVPVWKPTILVVDDSAMNRKVDICAHILSYQPPSHTQNQKHRLTNRCLSAVWLVEDLLVVRRRMASKP